MKVSVVIPTYNEAENIEELINNVYTTLDEHELEIVVVDDGSPDGTGGRVRRLQKQLEGIILVERDGKKGLGSAYKHGFSLVSGERVVQMDADFSHPVERIPRMLELLEDYDFVVGSRYVDSGVRDDPWYRQILPMLGSWGYRLLVGSPVKDITSGFKAYRSECTEILTEKSLPDGFEYQPGSVMELVWNGFNGVEAPITFRSRKAGEPKFSWREIYRNLFLLVKLSLRRFFGTLRN